MLIGFAARAARMVGVLVVVSIITFSMTAFLPGDPVAAVYGADASEEQIAHIRGELGLDDPLVSRYFDWVSGVVTLDFGASLAPPVRPVGDLLIGATLVTLELAVLAALIALLISVPAGVVSAYFADRLTDKVVSAGSFALVSVPPFVSGLLLILLVVFTPGILKAMLLAAGIVASVVIVLRRRRALSGRTLALAAVPAAVAAMIVLLLPDFPRTGWVTVGESPLGNLQHAFLPALTMGLAIAPLWAQVLRSDLRRTLQQDFITVARTRGATPRQVIFREALRPSLFSLVTVAAMSFGSLLAGSVVVESIFGIPGLGRTLVVAVSQSDYLVIQGGVLIAATVFVVLNALVDVGYSLLDPRIRLD